MGYILICNVRNSDPGLLFNSIKVVAFSQVHKKFTVGFFRSLDMNILAILDLQIAFLGLSIMSI